MLSPGGRGRNGRGHRKARESSCKRDLCPLPCENLERQSLKWDYLCFQTDVSNTNALFPSLLPTRRRCFRAILACLRAALGFLQLRIITGFQKEISQEWIRPWILPDVCWDIPAESDHQEQWCPDCPSQPLGPPHHSLWRTSKTSIKLWREKKLWINLEVFLLLRGIGYS